MLLIFLNVCAAVKFHHAPFISVYVDASHVFEEQSDDFICSVQDWPAALYVRRYSAASQPFVERGETNVVQLVFPLEPIAELSGGHRFAVTVYAYVVMEDYEGCRVFFEGRFIMLEHFLENGVNIFASVVFASVSDVFLKNITTPAMHKSNARRAAVFKGLRGFS